MSLLRTKIDGFYLMERIGGAGMSEVYLGIQPKTFERRSFKILGKCSFAGPSVYACFTREIDTIRALSHPNIVPILGHGALEDRYYYSMEHVPGGNLGRRIEHGSIPVDAALPLFLPVCAAIAYAHDCGVMHRDLKPSNILFNKRGEPVVSDFGIARVLNFEKASSALSGEILGTIAYLAPEQRFGEKKVNRAADVYALGAILYEMLMGFPALGIFPKPAEVLPGFDQALQDFLAKCLATNPEERFEHAGQMQLELEKCCNPTLFGTGTLNPVVAPAPTAFAIGELVKMPPAKADRIESWLNVLRTGTTRERLTVVREMAEKISPSEAKTIVKLYPEEGDRVRWGLIRVLGELKIEAATPLILNDLRNSFHCECAIEALGKIGSEEAYVAIRDYITGHPEDAIIGLLPLARTGKQKAIKLILNYLGHDKASLRRAAVQALGSIRSTESLQALKERLCVESDERVKSALFQTVHSLQAILLPDVTEILKMESLPAAHNF
jgi:hypothetical protein